MKTVAVNFSTYGGIYTGKAYYYKCRFDDVAEGDYLVVEVPNGSFSVVRVVEVYPDCVGKETCKQIVDKVNVSAYRELVSDETRMKDIKSILDAKLSESTCMSLYERLAEDNPDVAELLCEYKDIRKRLGIL